MSFIQVLVADDHPIVRRGICDLLTMAADIKVVGEASSGQEVLALVPELQPDVLLLDMELPDITGVEVVERLVESGQAVKILGLSSYDDREYISQLLSLGAAGYLIKDEVPESILEAVRGVARGESGWVSRQVAVRLSEILQADDGPPDSLSARELEVLAEVVAGKTNAGIGQALGISEKTVEKHLDSIYRKMEVSSRVEAAVKATRGGYLE